MDTNTDTIKVKITPRMADVISMYEMASEALDEAIEAGARYDLDGGYLTVPPAAVARMDFFLGMRCEIVTDNGPGDDLGEWNSTRALYGRWLNASGMEAEAPRYDPR